MADVTRTVQVKVSADSSAFDSGLKGTDKAVGNLGGAFGKLKGDMNGVLSGLGPLGGAFASLGQVAINPIVGISAAVLGLGAGLFKLGEDFDAATDAIRIGTGATGADLASLEGSFEKVFTSVPVGMDKVSSTIADLNTNLGLTGAPLEKLAVQFIDLERLGLGFSGNVQTITRVFGDWSVATDDQAGAMDSWRAPRSPPA